MLESMPGRLWEFSKGYWTRNCGLPVEFYLGEGSVLRMGMGSPIGGAVSSNRVWSWACLQRSAERLKSQGVEDTREGADWKRSRLPSW